MSPPAVEIVPVTDEELRAAAYAIRFEVFVDEQRVPADLELDDLDAVAAHLLVLVGGAPAATGRLVTEPPGFEGLDPDLGPVAHLGRIAVRLPHRGTGLGAAVVQALEADAVAEGRRVAYLSGQVVAVGFYEKLGYRAYGPVTIDANIPHRHMARML